MGCTNKGLFFDVSPESIVFDSVTTVRPPVECTEHFYP
jgi:hypothetical protein